MKSVGASLKVKWTVVELAATLTSAWLSMVTAAVGVTVSTVKLPVSAAVPALPLSSCQLLLTEDIGGADVGAGVGGEGGGVVGPVDHGQAGEHAAG